MTQSARADADPGAAADVAEHVAAVVRAVPGVADLHPGTFGEVGTYLPGRRVPGVRITHDQRSGPVTDVHVTVYYDADVRDTAAQIRRALAQHFGGEIHVTVEDVVTNPTPL